MGSICSRPVSEKNRISTYLCLNCREAGHLRRDCPHPWPGQAPLDAWMLSYHRDQFIRDMEAAKPDHLCTRCKNLDVFDMFEGCPQYSDSWDINLPPDRQGQHCRSLGKCGTVVFLADCPLCVALFSQAPNPDSEEHGLVLISLWNMHRLDGYVSAQYVKDAPYDKCIIVATDTGDSSISLAFNESGALGPMRHESTQLGLAVQELDDSSVSLDRIQRFLSTCESLHADLCFPRKSSYLHDIKLIDVERRRIVRYPGEHCEYLAISYPWGDHPVPRFHVSGKLGKLPATLEDAMRLTQLLGKRYIWIDVICINQNNRKEKMEHIGKMDAIYEGSYATIVSLSGTSMGSGIARVPGSERPGHQQVSWMVEGQRLVGTGPALEWMVRHSIWGTRAWTLQEAFLSCRCLYLTDEQVYFECNAFQCCESLDESRSSIHQRHRSLMLGTDKKGRRQLGKGMLRKQIGFRTPGEPAGIYRAMLERYTFRHMKEESDVMNAFSGIMNYLTQLAYKSGDYWGHPKAIFNWSLLWWPDPNSARRSTEHPSWSWASRKGGIHYSAPMMVEEPLGCGALIKAWGFEEGESVLIFPSLDPDASLDQNAIRGGETVFDRIDQLPLMYEDQVHNLDVATAEGHVLLECVVCELEFHLEAGLKWSGWNDSAFHEIDIQSVRCVLRSIPGEIDSTFRKGQTIKLTGLALMTRELMDCGPFQGMVHSFFQISISDKGNCSRTGRCYSVIVPFDHSSVVSSFHIERQRFILR